MSSPNERSRLLEAGLASPSVRAVSDYIAAEEEQGIDTSAPALPELPAGAKSFFKELTYFSNAGYVVELAAFAIITLLGFQYVFGGCVMVGGGIFALAFTTGWLSVPQVFRPFVTSIIFRWFLVTNHSAHITGLCSILAGFAALSYFSWSNSCRVGSKPIEAGTISVLTLLSVGIVLFLIACYRDEKGNGGYIRWILKFLC